MKPNTTIIAIVLAVILMALSFTLGYTVKNCPICPKQNTHILEIKRNEIKKDIEILERDIITLPIDTGKRTRDSLRQIYNRR